MLNPARSLPLLLALFITVPAGAEPLDAKTPVRGWTILSNSEPDAMAVIAAAKAYNINHLELSHHIVHDLREIRDAKRQALVNRLVDAALTVLLGSLSGISISKLLIGGVLPGLLLSLAFIAYIIVRVKLKPELAPASAFQEYTGWEKLRPFFQYVLPLVSIFVIVVASMSAGWATPTESAAIGALATVALALAYRALTLDNLRQSLVGTASISGMILFIIVGATTFSQILSFSGASNGLVEMITEQGLPPLVVVAGMMLILMFLGVFVDQVSMMMITLPIFMPVVQRFGVDPVWFGVMFLICMQMGLLLPPHGMLLMTMKGVAPPEVTMAHIFRAVAPFVVMSLLMLMLVFFVPAVALWLPGMLG